MRYKKTKILNTVEKLRKKEPTVRKHISGRSVKRKRLTNVSEVFTLSPISRKRSIREIQFQFIVKNKSMIVTSRSNLLPPSRSRTAFNQCYQRALAQLPASPTAVRIIRNNYISYEKVAK